jgi:hypothetical protein
VLSLDEPARRIPIGVWRTKQREKSSVVITKLEIFDKMEESHNEIFKQLT